MTDRVAPADTASVDTLSVGKNNKKGTRARWSLLPPKEAKGKKAPKVLPDSVLRQMARDSVMRQYNAAVKAEEKARQKADKALQKDLKKAYHLHDTTTANLKASGMPQELFHLWMREVETFTHERQRLEADAIAAKFADIAPDSLRRQQRELIENLTTVYNNQASRTLTEYGQLCRAVDANVDLQADPAARQRVANYFRQQLRAGEYYNLFSEKTDDELRRHVANAFSRDSFYQAAYVPGRAKNLWQRLTLHTNLFDWTLATPNIALEFDLSRHAKSNYSALVGMRFNPKTNEDQHPRWAYNIVGLRGELRKYWRTGGMQTVENELYGTQLDYNGEPGFDDPLTYQYRWAYNGDHTDSARVTAQKSSQRLWHRLRYRALTGRYVRKPRVAWTYYVGVQAAYEKYLWCLPNVGGRQGRRIEGGVSFGAVKNLMQLRNGAALDLEIGAALGLQLEGSSRFEHFPDGNCYHFLSSRHRQIAPYPSPHDLHISLRYSLRPIGRKVNRLYHVLRYKDKTDAMAYDARVQLEDAVARREQQFRQQQGADSQRRLAEAKLNKQQALADLVSRHGQLVRTDSLQLAGQYVEELYIFRDSVGEFHLLEVPDPAHPGQTITHKIYHPRKKEEEQKK